MSDSERYRSLIRELRKMGMSAHMMRPAQLVFGADCGKSAWLTIDQGSWALITWAPRLYRIPEGISVSELCDAFVKDSAGMAIVADQLISRFKLSEATMEEVDALMDSPIGGSFQSIAAHLKKQGLDVEQSSPSRLVIFGKRTGHLFNQSRTVSLFFYKEQWHVGTIGPRVYRVPLEERAEDVCLDCFNTPTDFHLTYLSEDLVARHVLEELSFEELMEFEGAP